jgi:hypothetical protein
VIGLFSWEAMLLGDSLMDKSMLSNFVRHQLQGAGRGVYAVSLFDNSENAGLVCGRLCLGNAKRPKRRGPPSTKFKQAGSPATPDIP